VPKVIRGIGGVSSNTWTSNRHAVLWSEYLGGLPVILPTTRASKARVGGGLRLQIRRLCVSYSSQLQANRRA
jgi:hypothetical protein